MLSRFHADATAAITAFAAIFAIAASRRRRFAIDTFISRFITDVFHALFSCAYAALIAISLFSPMPLILILMLSPIFPIFIFADASLFRRRRFSVCFSPAAAACSADIAAFFRHCRRRYFRFRCHCFRRLFSPHSVFFACAAIAFAFAAFQRHAASIFEAFAAAAAAEFRRQLILSIADRRCQLSLSPLSRRCAGAAAIFSLFARRRCRRYAIRCRLADTMCASEPISPPPLRRRFTPLPPMPLIFSELAPMFSRRFRCRFRRRRFRHATPDAAYAIR